MTTDQIEDEPLALEKVHEILKDTALNANNRCDQCGAQAYVHIAIVNKPATLMFCGHHWQALEHDTQFTILRDERASLLERPSFASMTDAL